MIIISTYNIIYLILMSVFIPLLIKSAPGPLDELTNNVNTGVTFSMMEYGEFCSGSWVHIKNEETCKAASTVLGLDWGKSWNGDNDFPGCLHTKDDRNKVYFNKSPNPSNDSHSNPKFENYAEICTPYTELPCPSININTRDRHDEEVLKSIKDPELCSIKCRDKTTCNFWSWASKHAGQYALDCVLMSGYGYTVHDINVMSGARSCDPSEHSCYADDPTPYRNFGLATSYLVNANLDTTEISVPGCKPVMLWMLTRHGTRGPRQKFIKAMIDEMPGIKEAILKAWADGKSKMCQKDIMHLENWKLLYSPDDDQTLGEAGRKEMRELGKRSGKRFPDLLKNWQKIVRKTSIEQRCCESMDAFLKGLYGHPVDFEYSTDAMFTFYDICPAFVQLQKDDKTYVEYKKMQAIEAYEMMEAKVSHRTGVQLTKEQVHLAYAVCGFDVAHYPDKVSPWCALLSEGDLQLMEYSYNILNYYMFHFNITKQMTQPLMADLHQKLSLLKESNEIPSAFLYQVQNMATSSLLVALGLYRDEEPPLASDWPNPHTVWDTSYMSSFGSNLGFVALECDHPQNPLKVLAINNERRISMADFCGEEICPLQSFLNKIQPIVNVDFDKVCELKEPYNYTMVSAPNYVDLFETY